MYIRLFCNTVEMLIYYVLFKCFFNLFALSGRYDDICDSLFCKSINGGVLFCSLFTNWKYRMKL